ncbi:hypothetical protein AcW1_004072 [Taiwanofungus camphoratus]|nr:hypothetical protein AcW1_004072 [Antrodia cinnamomea]
MLFGAGATIAIVVIVLVIVLPVTLVHKHHRTSSVTGTALPTSNPESPTGATSGGNGSITSTADNVTFTYINSFGGYWVYDPANPYNNSARAQSWSPALDEEWDYSTNRIQGVNLGGWLVLEPFIVPALFEKYQNETPSNALPGGNVVDEWTLSIAMLNDTSPSGGIQQIEEHYATFITEQDFAQIAGAGLNWIRLPIPYWAIEAWPGEPFLAKAAWKYVLLAFQWARKYGLRVLLDLHTIPGSQNGLNHSGRAGTINFLNGPMGIANADRALGYIRILTEFITQEQYVNVVPMWGIINEPLLGIIGRDPLTRFYLKSYEMIRNITGTGNGAYMVIHDGFQSLGSWADFLPGSDRIVLDTHPYVVRSHLLLFGCFGNRHHLRPRHLAEALTSRSIPGRWLLVRDSRQTSLIFNLDLRLRVNSAQPSTIVDFGSRESMSTPATLTVLHGTTGRPGRTK